MSYRVYLRSMPGCWELYNGYVDVNVESEDEAFPAAVAKLAHTSFRDRPSMSSWRLERIEVQ